MKVGRLISDSKWRAENTFAQYFFIIFKNMCVLGGGGC